MFYGLTPSTTICGFPVTPSCQQNPRPASRDALERAQLERLRGLMGEVRASNTFYRRKLSGAGGEGTPAASLDAVLSGLPFTTKAELQEDQERHPPFGTNLTQPLERYSRVHQTSGSTASPLRWLDTPSSWDRLVDAWGEVYRGAGVVPADRVFFAFSFGPFIGFWAGFESAARLGSLAIPGGGLTTAARLSAILDMGATVVVATPTYALHMAEAARAGGIDLAKSPVRALIVAGEPGGSVPATKARIEAAWGARCFDHCGMTEVGPFGFECMEAPGGLHALESEFIVEVVDPATGKRASSAGGEARAEGELVITNLCRAASPVIRYRTGDLVRWSTRPCPCGRPWGRFEGGILTRIDDMLFIRGNNLYPSAVEAIIRSFPDVGEYQAKATRKGEMTSLEIQIEPGPGVLGGEALGDRVSAAVERAFLFRAAVKVVPPGSLPRYEMKGKRFTKEVT